MATRPISTPLTGLLGAALVLTPAVAHGSSRTSTRAAGPQGLESAPAEATPQQTGLKPQTIYINFDGATLSYTPGMESAPQNTTFAQELARAWPPYAGDEAERMAIADMVRIDYADFDAEITTERPAVGPYIMILVTGERPFGDERGSAELDCWDTFPDNIGMAYYPADSGDPPSLTAVTIAHEAAHSLGMHHVMDTSDVMFGQIGIEDPTFVDACLRISGMVRCPDQQARHCPPGQQNSYASLLALMGPRAGGNATESGGESSATTGADDGGGEDSGEVDTDGMDSTTGEVEGTFGTGGKQSSDGGGCRSPERNNHLMLTLVPFAVLGRSRARARTADTDSTRDAPGRHRCPSP